MAMADAIVDTGHWSAEAVALRIEYALPVLERIRADAVTGLCRFPRGGIEVGGILFGTAEGSLVRILACRPVASEYASGPSYALSEQDEAGFRRTLEAARTDPALSGLEPVGWYHSHTRSEVFLSPQDLEIQNRYFVGSCQIALVVRPEPFGSVRAGFFVREQDGTIRSESSYREVLIPVPARARHRAPGEPRTDERESGAGQDAAAMPATARPGEPYPDVKPARGGAWRWYWVTAAALFLAAIAALVVPGRREAVPLPRPLALRVLDFDGQLQIVWDPSAVPAKEVRRGSVNIVDGTQRVVVPLDSAGFREGGVTYARRSGSVEVRLRVERAQGPQEEYVRFLGRPVSAPTAVIEPVQPPAGTEPESPVLETRSPLADAAAQEPRAREPARVKPAPRKFDLARLPVRRAASRSGALPAPPAVAAGGGGAVPGGGIPVLSSPALQAAPPPPRTLLPVARENRPKPSYTGPQSGRIIWTGDLVGGSSLSIDGRQASAGVASGELPGVAVRISVYPADLSAHGLSVFTAGLPRRSEPPGPQNGWNATSYSQDSRRAGELLVIESPVAQNGWKKVVLRNDGRSISVVLIDWRVAE